MGLYLSVDRSLDTNLFPVLKQVSCTCSYSKKGRNINLTLLDNISVLL